MVRLIRLSLFGLCACWLLFSAAAPRAHTASALPQQQQQPSAGKGAQVKAIEVREIDTEGLKKLLAREGKGARPLLVTFWATWCEPCRAEFPDLVKIDTEFRPRGLDFIAVSIDDVAEIKTTVPRFLEGMRAQMPAYLLNTPEPDDAINYVDPQWGGSLPATFLYDAQGKIVFKHIGRIKPEELRTAINKVMSDE